MAGPLYDLLPGRDAPDSDELLSSFLDYVASLGLVLYPAQEEALLELFEGTEPHPQHADRLGEDARRLRPALLLPRPRAALRLHEPDQGPRQREVDGALPRARPGVRRPLHRGRHRQPRRAGAVLHRRGPGQHRPARGGGGAGGRRGDGRVPLVRGPRPGCRLAGAAPHPAPGALPPDVGHPGRRDVLRGGAHQAQRLADRDREVGRATGAARVRVLGDPAVADPGEAGRRGQGARLRGPLHPGGRRGQRAELHQPQPRHPRREERGGGGDRGLPLHQPLRPRHPQVAQAGDRPAPRRPPPQVPRAGRAAGPEGPAQGHLRHGHPGGGNQRPHKDRALLAALQVRRAEDRGPFRARLPPDRGTRGAQGLRRSRLRGGAGPGARHREPPARGEGEGRQEGRQAEAARAQLRELGPRRRSSGSWARPRSGSPRASRSPTGCS